MGLEEEESYFSHSLKTIDGTSILKTRIIFIKVVMFYMWFILYGLYYGLWYYGLYSFCKNY